MKRYDIDWGKRNPPVQISRGLLRRVFCYFIPHRGRGLVVVACIILEAALGLAPAVVFKTLIDYLTRPNGDYTYVLVLVGAAVGIALVNDLVTFAESYLTAVIGQNIAFELRRELFDRLLDQSISFFTHGRSGDLVSRMNNDVGGVEGIITDTVFGLARNALVMVATLALMLRFSWQLTLVALVVIPLVKLPGRRFGNATYRARSRTQNKLSEMTSYLQEILGISGILLVKAFVKGRIERERFGRLNDEVRRSKLRQEIIKRRFDLLMNGLTTAGYALIMLVGGYLLSTRRISVGTVFAFAAVLGGRLSGSIMSLATMYVNVVGSLAVFHRLFAYIDLTPEIIDAPNAIELVSVRGAVRFEHVAFTYPSAARPALTDITFEVAPGQLVALVGPSGAGKTTITNLVPRFYDPQSGGVLIDGHDLRTLTLESVVRHIGLVFQETFLFNASIRDNLLYARPNATDEELSTAVRSAHLEEFIETLPDGYDTIVGERGHRLSGGQKQRLAIARVILKDPRILILDEATSHLDTISEQLIQAALQSLFRGRTSLVIAHRLSTILTADLICVLDHGRIIEQGTHTELLQRSGLYATLYQRQFTRPNQDTLLRSPR
ncbi:MAG: ABC transporter ATP-binding protein [Egibacteraceae bacterium]